MSRCCGSEGLCQESEEKYVECGRGVGRNDEGEEESLEETMGRGEVGYEEESEEDKEEGREYKEDDEGGTDIVVFGVDS